MTASRPARMRAAPRRERGAVAVAFAVMAALLFGFMGLAVDGGRLFVSKSEVQNAADACALAAAAALTGANADQLTQAENWGRTAGERNLIGFQASAPTIAADVAVTFSRTLDGTYQPKSAIAAGERTAMRFARCTLREDGMQPLVLQVLNMLPGVSVGTYSSAASAVSTLAPSISNCALPLAVCSRGAAPGFGMARGEWIEGRFEAGGGMTGAYKWIQYPGYTRVNDLRDLIQGTGQCNLNGGSTVQSHNGQIATLMEAWNTRFGLYRGAPQVGAYPPDLTGHSYTPATWPARANAFPDFTTRRSTNAVGNLSFGGNWNWITSAQHQLGGDRRLVVGPIVDCDALAGTTGAVPILEWACFLMLHPVINPNDPMAIEYRGLARDIGSGCVSSGLPGGPGAGGPRVPTLVQ